MYVSIYDQYGIETGVKFQSVKSLVNNEDQSLEICGYILASGNTPKCVTLEPHVEADIFDRQGLLCYTCLAEQREDFWAQLKASFHIRLKYDQYSHMVMWEEAKLILRVVYLNR